MGKLILIFTLASISIFAQEPPLPPAPNVLNPPPGYVLVPIGVIATNDLVPKKQSATNSVAAVAAAVRNWKKVPRFAVNCPNCNGMFTNQTAISISTNGGRAVPNGNIVERACSFTCPSCEHPFTARNEKFIGVPVCVEE